MAGPDDRLVFSKTAIGVSPRHVKRVPVAQWIEHLLAEQKVVSSSLAGDATPSVAIETLSVSPLFLRG